MSFISRAEKRAMPGLDNTGAPVQTGLVEADDSRCTGCNLCIEVCPGKALEFRGDKTVRMIEVDLVPCMACGDCVAICEPGALRLSEPQRYTGFFKFLHRGSLSLPRVF